MTEVATMTPVQVDTFLAENWYEQAKAQSSIAGWQRYVNPRGREARDYERERGEAAIAELRETLAGLREAAGPYEARYAAERWNRYFLVTNGNGHVHRGMDCTTCYATTQYAWLIELADCDEAAMVADCGEKACTVCFPDAPSEYARLKAAGMLTRTERLTADEQEARRAEKQARADAKAAKAITAPDGTELRTRRWGTIRTLVTARNELTSSLMEVLVLTDDRRHRGEATRLTGLIAEYQADAEKLIEAIAFKTGDDPDTVRDTAQAKAEKKFRRDYGG
jgi:hypothetical protein